VPKIQTLKKMGITCCGLRSWALTLSVLEILYFIGITLVGYYFIDLKAYHWYGPYIWWACGSFFVFWSLIESICICKKKWFKTCFGLQFVKSLVALMLFAYFIYLFEIYSANEFHNRIVKPYFGDLLVDVNYDDSDIKYACKCLAFITISFTVLKTIFQGALCCKRESRRDGRQYSAISTIEAQMANEMSNPGFDTDAIGTNANSSIFTDRVFDLLVGCVQANPNLRATFTFP